MTAIELFHCIERHYPSKTSPQFQDSISDNMHMCRLRVYLRGRKGQKKNFVSVTHTRLKITPQNLQKHHHKINCPTTGITISLLNPYNICNKACSSQRVYYAAALLCVHLAAGIFILYPVNQDLNIHRQLLESSTVLP